jgi:predicted transcriptional regulator YdeE
MVAQTVSEGKYAVLTSERGPIPKVIVEAWQQIWNREDQGQLGGKRAYKTDFEVYDQRAHDPQDSQIDIYVGVK